MHDGKRRRSFSIAGRSFVLPHKSGTGAELFDFQFETSRLAGENFKENNLFVRIFFF